MIVAMPLVLRPILILILFTSVLPALAGPSPLDPRPEGFTKVHFGFKAGLAVTQHQGIEPRDMEYMVSSSMRTGMAAGAFLILPVTGRFGIQQEVLYVQKGSRQKIGADVLTVPVTMDVTYDQDYLEIPVLLRYHWITGRKTGFYTLAGFSFGLKINDRYKLSAVLDDGVDQVPIQADSDMSEVDLFDFAFTYGIGLEFPVADNWLLLEYRFDLSLQALPLPTYAYVPFGDDEILVENETVPLRNQAHILMVGFRF